MNFNVTTFSYITLLPERNKITVMIRIHGQWKIWERAYCIVCTPSPFLEGGGGVGEGVGVRVGSSERVGWEIYHKKKGLVLKKKARLGCRGRDICPSYFFVFLGWVSACLWSVCLPSLPWMGMIFKPLLFTLFHYHLSVQSHWGKKSLGIPMEGVGTLEWGLV